MAERPYLGGYVSPEAREGWRLFARSRGVSVTALLEALGPVLAELDDPIDELPAWARDAVRQAREIDADRRRRRDP